jgi:hypothetical protein
MMSGPSNNFACHVVLFLDCMRRNMSHELPFIFQNVRFFPVLPTLVYYFWMELKDTSFIMSHLFLPKMSSSSNKPTKDLNTFSHYFWSDRQTEEQNIAPIKHALLPQNKLLHSFYTEMSKRNLTLKHSILPVLPLAE